MSAGQEKLRPCPFCGDDQLSYFQVTSPKRDKEIQHACPAGQFQRMSSENWNSAYCWREIEALTQALNRCISAAGSPNAADACRNVIAIAKEALNAKGKW